MSGDRSGGAVRTLPRARGIGSVGDVGEGSVLEPGEGASEEGGGEGEGRSGRKRQRATKRDARRYFVQHSQHFQVRERERGRSWVRGSKKN